MPSPFPGMDFYLEGPEWSGFQAEFCVEIARKLAPQLRPTYVARINNYSVTATPDDLAAFTQNGMADKYASVAVKAAPLQLATVMPELMKQYVIEIRDVAERTLVALIEILSPANKRGEGYAEYLQKRRKILLSTAHLLEIDLLRKGKRVPMRQPLPDSPYFVFLSRYQKRPITDIWPVALEESLPVVPVPLLYGDADVRLDLQKAFTDAYDAIGLDLLVDYSSTPDIPIEDANQAQWVGQLLEKAHHS